MSEFPEYLFPLTLPSDQALLDRLAETARDSLLPTIIISGVSAANSVIFANSAVLAMTGHDRDAICGHPILDVLGGVADPYTLSLFRAAVRNGQAGLWQMKLQRENGATLLGVIFLNPIVNADKQLIALSINIVDLASLICIAKERESIFPGIYDEAPGFIAMLGGPDHRFDYANASYKAFVKRGNLIGKPIAEALPEIVDEGNIKILDAVYQTGIPFRASNMPISIWDPELGAAELRRIDVLYQPVRDQAGAIIGLFCEGHDVTELHEKNQALAALQTKVIHLSRVSAMGTMAATLAHELNQPLTAIANYLAGVRPLHGQAPEPDRLTMALSGIREASDRAAGIIDHLRQLIRHRQPAREPFNLREAVAECIRLVRSANHAASTFDNQVASHTIMMADRIKIQQVLINLLQNACDAMSNAEHAVVTISAVQGDEDLTVSVADNGTGVSPEAAATMFAWAESSKVGGMGIGLSICRTIIELYHGSIWLERSGPEGSEFRFSLPQPPPEDLGTDRNLARAS
ncbi:MAG: ATP-binding protein [Erythrobacter sp.]|nr:ATP-binding protein [Erythrobacter sp.]